VRALKSYDFSYEDMSRDFRKPFWRRIPLPRLRSLRVRLQVWYTGLLLAVVGLFGGLVYVQAQAEMNRRIDADLEGAVLVVDAILRQFPPHEFGNPPPGKPLKPPGPGKKQREDFLAELELPRAFVERGGYFAAWQGDGALIKSTGLAGEPRTTVQDLGGRPVILGRGGYREVWLAGPHGSKIVAGRSIVEDQNRLRTFGLTLLGIGIIAVALGMGISWLIARRIVRPLETMSDTAAAISGDDLGERIDVRGADAELADLAQVLNAMFARLQAAFERQQQFTADASHELRTPLSIIRSQSELALSRPRTPDEYRAALQSCLRAAERMSTLAQALLTLARSDAGKSLSLQNIALHELIGDCVHQLQASAAAKKVTMTGDEPDHQRDQVQPRRRLRRRAAGCRRRRRGADRPRHRPRHPRPGSGKDL
jgi:signal transduction histidine kinase